MKEIKLKIAPAPFIHSPLSIPRLMYGVILCLLPALFWGIYYFKIQALYLILACVFGTLFTEFLFCKVRGKELTLKDGSALLTGILLAMVLPPYLPLWMGFLGGVVAIALGKEVFGGLGYNIFNPALVGRAFLMASFPQHLTTWKIARGGFLHYDTITQATPLAQTLPKFGGKINYPLVKLLMGTHAGCLGEVPALLLIIGGLALLVFRLADYRIPLSCISTVAFLTGIFYLKGLSPSPLFHLLSGGLLLGAFFMATDPVTTPYTPKGRWIFGIGMGVLVTSVRLFGGYPEGVMFSILVMNAFTPLINRLTKPLPLGVKK
ncbi:MAG TPA: RnfABCDGE type electron transport complex subunit D [bacterium]|nr:RnfABCDGE type electron transport complex subunit D [bacterium]HEX68566.1 RnfABCDGE type electron transport complex subunit D [bacterium]